MENININDIRKKGFEEGSENAFIEDYSINLAGNYTDQLIERYNQLPESRNGNYINSDLMKMIFPFYAKNNETRRKYNLAVTNTAAVLTNETYKRAICRDDINRCIFVVGPYGAGKSFFSQSLFESSKKGLLENSIVYEGSITPPAFEEKIEYAIENGVNPCIIALNPTFELSMRNIKERAKTFGRDVEKDEVVNKFSDFYTNFTNITKKFNDISFVIYNKSSNIPLNLDGGSINIEDLNHGNREQILKEYDRVKTLLEREENIEDLIR